MRVRSALALVATTVFLVLAMPSTAFAMGRAEISDVTSTTPTLADTGVAFVPMLIAAAVVLVVVGIAVVLVRRRIARVER
jgi:hypothetical protein